MQDSLRVGTWNLDRSGIRGKSRLAPQKQFLEQLAADILVLTETHELSRPMGYAYCLQSERDPTYHQTGESCVAIHSRFPLQEVRTADENRYFTVCAEIQGLPGVGDIIVYGTIITYHGDGVREGVPAWSRHRLAVKTQVEEWKTIALRYPNHLILIAGDFNENLDGKHWYGVADAKEALTVGLKSAGICCPTAAPTLTLIAGQGTLSRSTVNHICFSEDKAELIRMEAWEGSQSGMALSDHNGIFLDLRITH